MKGGKYMPEERFIAKTKQDFLNDMYKQYERQQNLCELKYSRAIAIENSESNKMEANRKKTKQENTDLKEYNQQVAAACRTASMIIAITKSDLPVNEEVEDDELI